MPSRTLSALATAAGTAVLSGSLLAGSAGAATAHQITGTVIHHNARAHSFVVAAPSGALYAVHSAKSPALRSRVAVTLQELSNGTYVARHLSTQGHVAHGRAVRAHGVVSHVDRAAHTYTLSAHGVSMLVHTAGRRAHDTATTQPSVGSVVTTTGTVDDEGELDAQTTDVQGQDTNGYEIEGTVLSVDPAGRTITVSADDEDTSGQSITIAVPAPLTTADFKPGDEVELNVKDVNGTPTLVGSSDDEGAQGAEDQNEEQGQYAGDDDEDGGASSAGGAASGESEGHGSTHGSGEGE